MSADAKLRESVARLALFADLGEAELADLLEGMQETSYEEGKHVVHRGDVGLGLHVIVDGEAAVVLEDEELTTVSKGSFFGEISALLDEETVADVVARTRLHCLVVPAADVEKFLLANPRVMFRMLQTEARRLRAAEQPRN